MEIFDNITKSLINDLKKNIASSSSVSIVANCFSIYAYEALKKELASIKELRFIFASPAFVAEKEPEERREFYIPRLNRERSLYGEKYEIKLRNELTQKAIARECADWIRKKAKFRSNITRENMGGFFHIISDTSEYAYMPIDGFATADLGLAKGDKAYNMIARLESPDARRFRDVFDTIWNDKGRLRDVTAEVLNSVENVYRENSPELIYFIAIYSIFKEFLTDSEEVFPSEAAGFKNSAIWNKLYDFQKDAAIGVINKLERYNGCVLADSVGLGKTFTALAIIKYYEDRNKSVLVLCPKKLSENWITYKANYKNNPVAADRFRYDALYHTDLSRERGVSNGIDLERLNWSAYDLVVIDESHNFRNGGQTAQSGQKENRYLKLLNKVIRAGAKTKVLMLSATPVNNRFKDLRNQLSLACEGYESRWAGKLKIRRAVSEIFKDAQRAFNRWRKLPKRALDSLLSMLDMDFFELLDSVTIARSRKHIEKYYDMAALGGFPKRLPPIAIRPKLSALPDIDYALIFQKLSSLNLEVYSPSLYIFPSKLAKYENGHGNLTRSGREEGVRRLMAINLLKRLESSVNSFSLTVRRIKNLIETAIEAANAYEKNIEDSRLNLDIDQDSDDFDLDDQNLDFLARGEKLAVNLADIDYRSWRDQMLADLSVLDELDGLISQIRPEKDEKLQSLLRLIDQKQAKPINGQNKKILVFTAFADTAEYLFNQASYYAREKYGLHTALVTGTGPGKTTLPGFRPSLNDILINFAPIAKERDQIRSESGADIDILIATDCLSEGQNLQDCDYVVNYDIHWNPVRIIQRFGRIDRIGSPNEKIQLVNFWPDMALDDYINLKDRVESRMKASVLASAGDGDPLDAEDRADLEYRKRQLEQLQDSVLDMEDIAGGLSITDLGLNEFRRDALEIKRKFGDIETIPLGLSAVAKASDDWPPGVIFVLRNINEDANRISRNRLSPFYLVYTDMEGEPFVSYLQPQKILRAMRSLCLGRDRPDARLLEELNRETRDGKDMRRYSRLLGDAIEAIIGAKEDSDVESLFRPGGTSALANPIRGLDEFELICFLIIR